MTGHNAPCWIGGDAKGILCLVNGEAGGVAIKLDTQILLDRAKVICFESQVQMILELSDEVRVASCQKNVINID